MTIENTFDSHVQLSTIQVDITGAETATLTETDYTETDNGDGTYTYTATYEESTTGDFTFTLTTVEASGGESATWDGRSTTVTVDDSPTGAVAQYEFEDDSDTSVAVDSWNSHTGSIEGATYTTTGVGQGSYALDFANTSDRVLIDGDEDGTYDDPFPIDFATDGLTVASYIYPRDVSTNNVIWSGEGQSTHWTFRVNSSGYLSVIAWSSGSNTAAEGATQLSTNTLYHAGFTYDPSNDEIRIFLDGAKESTTAIADTLDSTENANRFGELFAGDQDLDGILDLPEILGTTYTDSEMADLTA